MDDDDDHELQQLDELEELAEWEQLLEVQSRMVLVRRDPFDYYSDEEFVHHYGFSKMCVNGLLEKIQHNLPTSQCRRGKYSKNNLGRLSPQSTTLAFTGT